MNWTFGTLNIRALADKRIPTSRILPDFCDICMLQETHITENSSENLGEWTLLNSGLEEDKWGGVAFLIKNKHMSLMKNFSYNSRICAVEITIKIKNITLINVYAPPRNNEYKKLLNVLETFLATLPKNTIKLIMGDFNG